MGLTLFIYVVEKVGANQGINCFGIYMKIWLTIFVLCFPVAASACRVADISTAERIAKAEHVYFGFVTAIHLESLETQKKKSGLFNEYDFLIHGDIKAYRILVKEKFKGKADTIVNVKIKWCGGGEAELGERVVVYFSKYGSYIEPLSKELYDSIKSNHFNFKN